MKTQMRKIFQNAKQSSFGTPKGKRLTFWSTLCVTLIYNDKKLIPLNCVFDILEPERHVHLITDN